MRLAKNMTLQCRSRRERVVGRGNIVWLRCQLPLGHTGKHFGPYGKEWEKTKRKVAASGDGREPK